MPIPHHSLLNLGSTWPSRWFRPVSGGRRGQGSSPSFLPATCVTLSGCGETCSSEQRKGGAVSEPLLEGFRGVTFRHWLFNQGSPKPSASLLRKKVTEGRTACLDMSLCAPFPLVGNPAPERGHKRAEQETQEPLHPVLCPQCSHTPD